VYLDLRHRVSRQGCFHTSRARFSSRGSISAPFRRVSKNALKYLEIKLSQVCSKLKVARPANFHVSSDCLADSTKGGCVLDAQRLGSAAGRSAGRPLQPEARLLHCFVSLSTRSHPREASECLLFGFACRDLPGDISYQEAAFGLLASTEDFAKIQSLRLYQRIPTNSRPSLPGPLLLRRG